MRLREDRTGRGTHPEGRRSRIPRCEHVTRTLAGVEPIVAAISRADEPSSTICCIKATFWGVNTRRRAFIIRLLAVGYDVHHLQHQSKILSCKAPYHERNTR